ncbi:MAG: hypothetical protein ABGY43_10725 [bacterium]|jgi:hypothetical protein|nr:hypothetical protein [Gammaproteobacteria bacterium]HIL83784.1 hypothetical protein [Pseudomonadales bacterium]
MNYFAIYLILVVSVGEFGVTRWQVKEACSTIEQCRIAKREYLQTTDNPDGVFICTIEDKGGLCTTEVN